jgi:cytochrome c
MRDAALRLPALVLVLGLVACGDEQRPAAEASWPRLGEPASAALVAAWDIDIAPDGRALPPGRGSALAGRQLFERNCAVCHGPGGAGGPGGDLVGGIGSLAGPAPNPTVGSYWPYATTLFDYVRRAMPYDLPGSLADADVYALVAYLLAENGIIDDDAVLDARALPRVAMPNRDGFRSAWTLRDE